MHQNLSKSKGTDYVLSWKSKGVYNDKLKILFTAFFHSTKVSGYKMEIKFDKNSLDIYQTYYFTKIENVYINDALEMLQIAYDFRNFTIKNCLFSPTITMKNSDNGKWVYSGYAIAFDGKEE